MAPHEIESGEFAVGEESVIANEASAGNPDPTLFANFIELEIAAIWLPQPKRIPVLTEMSTAFLTVVRIIRIFTNGQPSGVSYNFNILSLLVSAFPNLRKSV